MIQTVKLYSINNLNVNDDAIEDTYTLSDTRFVFVVFITVDTKYFEL